MSQWFSYPTECSFDQQRLWRAAVREVATLTDDQEALAWVGRLDETWDKMEGAGLIVGSHNLLMMIPDEKTALYEKLDRVLGVV
jgi:hypothetical protein